MAESAEMYPGDLPYAKAAPVFESHDVSDRVWSHRFLSLVSVHIRSNTGASANLLGFGIVTFLSIFFTIPFFLQRK